METSYTLTWNDNPPEELVDHYNVYRRVGQTNAYEIIATTNVSNFDPTNYLTSKKSAFRVTAVNANGEGLASVTAAINLK